MWFVRRRLSESSTTALMCSGRLLRAPPASRSKPNLLAILTGGKNLEILGADLASQCLQRGLVDEILVYVLPVLLGDGVRFSTPTLHRIDLEPFSNTQSGAVTMLRFRVPRAKSVL